MFDAKKLEKARILKRMKKGEVAAKAGFHPSVYGLVLKGKIQNPPTVGAIADILGLTMEEIYIEEEAEYAPDSPERRSGKDRRLS